MKENLFQNKNVDGKLRLILKAIIGILFVNNVLFAVFTIATGHGLWVFIPVLCMVITIVVGGGLGKALAANITKPLEELRKAADAMSEGNLDIQIEYKAADEFGSLAESFRKTAYFLKGVVMDID